MVDSIRCSYLNQQQFPLVIEPAKSSFSKQDLYALLKEENSYFKKELLKHGGLLIRNFNLENADDFSSVIESMGTGGCVNYVGGDSPRTKVKGNIYTSTEAPPSIKIPLHNELSFVKNYPSHIYFFCEIAPAEKGETIIGDARKIYNAIDAQVKKRFIERQLKYVSHYCYKNRGVFSLNKSHKTWINVFETEDKDEVVKKCLENEFGYKWFKNDWLEISQTRPAVMNHPQTGEKVWFNQVHLYDFNPRLLGWKFYIPTKIVYMQKHTRLHEVFFADGKKIPKDDLYHVMDVLDKETVAFPWKKGDVLILDNILAMHGRATFTGKRRVLTAMTR